MAPLAAVTFDFWNTIARVRPGTMESARRRAVAAACEECGMEVEPERLGAALERAVAGYSASWERGVHFHPREGAQILVRELGIDEASSDLVAEAFLDSGRGAELELAPGIGACLAELDGAGLRLGIVCDVGFSRGELLRGLLEAKGLLGRFDGWAFSDEVGAYKPSPRIFEAALDALGTGPANSLHVGDLRRTDVAGARAVGMRSVRYRGLNDDTESAPDVEADVVIDDHRELPALVG